MIGTIPLAFFETWELPEGMNLWLPALGVLLITMSMMMGLRKRRRRPSANVSARDHVDELRQKQAVRGDLEQLMIEVEQLAKRFGTQLDAKTMQMERLIDEANLKIEELKQLEQARRDVESIRPPVPPVPPVPPETPEPPDFPVTSESSPTPSTPNPQSPTDPDAELKYKVCGLADAGHDPIEIAKQLDEHVGKVELILALRKA